MEQRYKKGDKLKKGIVYTNRFGVKFKVGNEDKIKGYNEIILL